MCTRWMDPQGLVNDCLKVWKLEGGGGVDFFVGSVSTTYFICQLAKDVRCLENVEKSCGQGRRRGLSASNAF